MPSGTLGQFVRFAIVGLVSNGVLYVAYILLTAVGLGPKLAMTLIYVLGTLQGFLFNKHWSFRSGKAHGPELVRYVLAYAFGYLVNLVVLLILVDRWGLPHQAVQGAMIVVLAFLLFALQKFWVFPAPSSLNSEPA
jgi:putative flippase GtrA